VLRAQKITFLFFPREIVLKSTYATAFFNHSPQKGQSLSDSLKRLKLKKNCLIIMKEGILMANKVLFKGPAQEILLSGKVRALYKGSLLEGERAYVDDQQNVTVFGERGPITIYTKVPSLKRRLIK
jgi:hypothetical protein